MKDLSGMKGLLDVLIPENLVKAAVAETLLEHIARCLLEKTASSNWCQKHLHTLSMVF